LPLDQTLEEVDQDRRFQQICVSAYPSVLARREMAGYS
jgi:hypothetical protein